MGGVEWGWGVGVGGVLISQDHEPRDKSSPPAWKTAKS